MNSNLSWKEVELSINEELSWIKRNVNPYFKNNNFLDISDDILYRIMAILIVSGRVKATEFSFDINTFLKLNEFENFDNKMHGSDWHDSVIKNLSIYFNDLGFDVKKDQPALFYGYADILILKNKRMIYIEVDTVSIFKLCINLLSMNDICIINIKSDKIIKFEL